MPETPHRILHTMLRVSDLERSLFFYTQLLGMKHLRRGDHSSGRFTLAFVGYGSESDAAVLELTHNWDRRSYTPGDAFGHIALAAVDIHAICRRLQAHGVAITRAPGPMAFDVDETIAFLKDPDGYSIELIERP